MNKSESFARELLYDYHIEVPTFIKLLMTSDIDNRDIIAAREIKKYLDEQRHQNAYAVVKSPYIDLVKIDRLTFEKPGKYRFEHMLDKLVTELLSIDFHDEIPENVFSFISKIKTFKNPLESVNDIIYNVLTIKIDIMENNVVAKDRGLRWLNFIMQV